ncbi:MAG: peptide-methionine (S)-S-oxide reductase [Geobacteraceae bacterium GWC2_58_44]|nr:MAG: peptide-methionine (S)-S-oxide reductase [Geobacteraceae bacterium GWC2_58_44]HBG06464.1 peptide-methionine (S)-S-oxide reductase [Geobacter sp.]
MEPTSESHETAIFAGGCFWCMEPVFDATPGVISVTPGYTGGSTSNPSYQEVCAGESGHLEAVRVVFDPDLVSYRTLLGIFWRNIDPTARNRQFCDFGSQYQSAIFYLDQEQKRAAEESRQELEQSHVLERPVATEIRPAGEFYPAEEYHHKYYRKNPERYRAYHEGCGRKGRLQELWGR